MNRWNRCGIGILAIVVASTAQATPILVSGQVTVLPTPPASVVLDALESDTTAYLFQEQSNLTLPADVSVGISQPGTYTLNSQFAGALIPAGTPYISTFTLHTDPVGDPTVSASYAGSITFPGETILGIIFGPVNLVNTDPALGSPTTTYSSSNFRGYAFLGGPSACAPGDCDTISLSADRQTVTFISNVNSLDELRILVQAPEPATWLPVGFGLIGFALWRRRAAFQSREL